MICSEAAQLERLARSRGMTAEEVRRRRANQMPPEQMARAADRVIDTNGTLEETEEKVRQAVGRAGAAATDETVEDEVPERHA